MTAGLNPGAPPAPETVSRVLNGSGDPVPVPQTPDDVRRVNRRITAHEASERIAKIRADFLKTRASGVGGAVGPPLEIQPTATPPASPVAVTPPSPAAPAPAAPVVQAASPPAAAQVAGAPASQTVPSPLPGTAAASATEIEFLKAQHAADLARAAAAHEQELATLRAARPAGAPAQEAPPVQPVELPDPDVDPGGYVRAVVEPLQREAAERRQREATEATRRNVEAVQSYVRGKLSELPLFASRGQLAASVERQVMQELFLEQHLSPANVQALANEKVLRLAVALEKEVGGVPSFPVPSVPAPPARAAAVAEQLAVNATLPGGAPAAAPAPGTYTGAVKYDHGNEEMRTQRAKEHLQHLAAKHGVTKW